MCLFTVERLRIAALSDVTAKQHFFSFSAIKPFRQTPFNPSQWGCEAAEGQGVNWGQPIVTVSVWLGGVIIHLALCVLLLEAHGSCWPLSVRLEEKVNTAPFCFSPHWDVVDCISVDVLCFYLLLAARLKMFSCNTFIQLKTLILMTL